jgi:hypothetical protein
LDAIDWSRARLDSVSVRAKRGGEHTGPNPTDLPNFAAALASPWLNPCAGDDLPP